MGSRASNRRPTASQARTDHPKGCRKCSLARECVQNSHIGRGDSLANFSGGRIHSHPLHREPGDRGRAGPGEPGGQPVEDHLEPEGEPAGGVVEHQPAGLVGQRCAGRIQAIGPAPGVEPRIPQPGPRLDRLFLDGPGERRRFLDRLVTVALPRVRDFRGLDPKSFDGRGNYALGIKEHIVFPEIDYDKAEAMLGLDIVVCTTARTDAEARALLRAFNFPFRQ